MIVVMFLSMIIQNMLQSRFEKYSRVRTNSGMTGAEIARKMLADHGITDVKVTCIPGRLTDHYNPQTKTVNLSESVYNESSVAAAAVAAHECGHVVQHEKGYLPLKLRTALVPVVSFSSNIVQWVLLAGVLMVTMFHSYPVLIAGIVLFALTTLFSFVTLPRSTPATGLWPGLRMPGSRTMRQSRWRSMPSNGQPTPTWSRR